MDKEDRAGVIRKTAHGERRHADAGRPTAEASRDKAQAREVYRDSETGYYVFVGPRGRTHIFTPHGEHHTSFRTTSANRESRTREGRWVPIPRPGLSEEVR